MGLRYERSPHPEQVNLCGRSTVPISDPNTKLCPKCQQTLPIVDFYRVNKSNRGPGRDRKTGNPKDRRTHTSWCKHCRKRKYDVEYARRVATGEAAEANKRWYPKVWERRLLRDYGITPVDYAEMLDAQGGVCAICGEPETTKHKKGTVRQLSVDHNHKTGKVRGLLCHNCNCGIGRLKDDIEKLRKAIAYLESHEER